MAELSELYPVRTGRDRKGALTLCGHSLVDLANSYGTPLYIYDADTVRFQVACLREYLNELYPGPFEIAYAAKAYFSLGIARKMAGLSLGVDVVSLGELKIAQKAGFDPGRDDLSSRAPAHPG